MSTAAAATSETNMRHCSRFGRHEMKIVQITSAFVIAARLLASSSVERGALFQ